MSIGIATIEDSIIDRLEALSLFRAVISIGRRQPETLPLALPAAEVIFDGDRYPKSNNPRAVPTMQWSVFVSVKNMKSSAAASRDAYALIDTVRDDLDRRTFPLLNTGELNLISRELTDYHQGVITYRLVFTVIVPLDLPAA